MQSLPPWKHRGPPKKPIPAIEPEKRAHNNHWFSWFGEGRVLGPSIWVWGKVKGWIIQLQMSKYYTIHRDDVNLKLLSSCRSNSNPWNSIRDYRTSINKKSIYHIEIKKIWITVKDRWDRPPQKLQQKQGHDIVQLPDKLLLLWKGQK